MRPTPRLALLMAAAAPLAVLAGGMAPSFWALSFDFAAILVAAFALDAFLTLSPRSLRADISAPLRAFIGETVTLTVTLETAPGARTATLEILPNAHGDIADPGIEHCRATPGAIVLCLLKLVPTRRGTITVTSIAVRWHGPFGLNQRLLTIPFGKTIDIVPNIRGVQTAALEFNDRDSPAGLKIQRDRGAGTEFESLRDYLPGMDIGAVDWKHSARHGRLVAREYRAERNHPVILAFDTGHLMRDPIDGVPRLDHAISAGLLLGWIALRGGDIVGTYAFDSRVRHWGPPQRGTASFARLQHQAAGLNDQPEETNFTLGIAELSGRLKRRALVVLFTDFVDTITTELMLESMGRLGGRHVVVFVSLRDPSLQTLMDAPPDHAGAVGQAVVASDFLRERRTVFAQLDRMGVHCVDVDRHAVSAALINRYVAIKQRGLL
jgi:uncharacterized protein (DUF58 family)